MASTKHKSQPIGSVQWIQQERSQASEFVAQEIEEFEFSARNEMEWLNEHMSDVFSTAEVRFADVFKTPGKLRGKTPRTARKRDVPMQRQPLADLFAPVMAPPPVARPTPKANEAERTARFDIAEDSVATELADKPISRGKSPQRGGIPYTDSGYHGMTEDDTDIDARTASIDASSQDTQSQKVSLREDSATLRRPNDSKGDDTGTSDESFVSAKEPGSQISEPESSRETGARAAVKPTSPAGSALSQVMQDLDNQGPTAENVVIPMDCDEEAPMEDGHDTDVDMGESDTPRSELSSPEKPLQRKSSFNFSALPARQPLGTKKSIGQLEMPRSSTLGRSFGTRALEPEDDTEVDVEEDKVEVPGDIKEPSKTSTQLLHERINLLGKMKEPRPSKSIPSSVLVGSIVYPQLPETDGNDALLASTTTAAFPTDAPGLPSGADEDADWIAPTKLAPSQSTPHKVPSRPVLHQKSISTTILPSPNGALSSDARHQKAFSVSQLNVSQYVQSTTPSGSPSSKKTYEGPLSASKNRLWSALKSAKNIFASSASTSAAAKLEAYSSSPVLTRNLSDDSRGQPEPGFVDISTMQQQSKPDRPMSAISLSPSRRTRSSTESDRRREKEARTQQKADEDLEKARERERQKAAKQQADEKARAEKANRAGPAHSERPASTDSERHDLAPQPPPKSGGMSLGKLRAPGRLMKPSKEALSSKPAPVSIRVASQSQRLGQGTSSQVSLSKSQHEGMPPPPPPKDGGPRAASSQSNKGGHAAPTNARVRALEAAARKKEADEKAAQRKAEQKRELERKRAAKAEEERRADEERKAVEQQRIQEAKLAAQRKAEKLANDARRREQERIEQQKLEQQRREQERLELQRQEQERVDQQRREQERMEQQRRDLEAFRQQEEARKAKEAHDLAEAIRRERAQQAGAHPRGEVGGTLRQLVKTTVPVHHNPAKPAKRQFAPEDDESSQHSQRPQLQRAPASYQQTEAKRRRTSNENTEQNERHSVMAPPKRPSNWRKDTLSKVPHGYTHAPQAAQHHNSMYKTALAGQHQVQQHGHKPGQPLHPSQMVQISNARIPFGDNSNAPGPAYNPSYSQQTAGGYDNMHPNKFKTPARAPLGFPKSAGHTKPNTPSYLAGDAIELPDIATDSEDEESEDEAPGGFRAPSWVASPALRELLTQQQLVDPESVFGPIGELKMDEVFKNGKNPERLKRFRDRGSSAMWVESGDAVTSAEKRRDMEMRERVAREGGWRYEPGA